jgi:hypothetical protein
MYIHYPSPHCNYRINGTFETSKDIRRYFTLCKLIDEFIYKFKNDITIKYYGTDHNIMYPTFVFTIKNFNKNRELLKWYYNNTYISYPVLIENNTVLLNLN